MSTRSVFPQPDHTSITQTKPIPARVPFAITVIGKPGSGKSTLIELLVGKFQGQNARRFQVYNDRDVLLQMAQEDGMAHLIRPRDALNFEILDERAYDVAIDELLTIVCRFGNADVSLIEFSRRDYLRTFEQCAPLLAHKQSFVIYVAAPFPICTQRNTRRAVLDQSHSVPSAEMQSYFRVDDIEQLIREYPKRVIVVANQLEKADLLKRVDELWVSLKDRI